MTESFSRPVAVTGATGYVAGHVVRELLERGATVHATARNPDNPDKVGHLERMADALPGKLELFAADLLEDGAFAEAFAGCEVVIHTASPFLVGKQKDPQTSLVDPALKGTRSVLQTVNEIESIRRVVLTSSVAAIYGDAIDARQVDGPLTEAHWNETSSLEHQPYSYSKTVAEREAWNLVGAQKRWDLVTINPGFVMGPSLTARKDSASIDFLIKLIDGTYAAGMSDFTMPWVDVRDVARAHVEAALRPEAAGRFILSAKVASIFEIIDEIRDGVPHATKLPRMKAPKWMGYLFAPFFGLTWKYVSRNVGIAVQLDHSRSVDHLGIAYRPLGETMRDHVQQLVDDGLYRPRG